MGFLKLKIYEDNEPIVKATGKNINDFDEVMSNLKKKFGNKKKNVYRR